MCIIAVCENRKLTKQEFQNCYTSNPDGFGIGWAYKGKTYYLKGFMTQKAAYAFYKQFSIRPHVCHFRIGTSGTITQQLCHPFEITKAPLNSLDYVGKSPLLFHNGIISNWDQMLTILLINNIPVPEPYNDTLVLAVTLGFLRAFNLKYSPVLDSVGGKYAILTPEKIYKHGDFTEEKGVFFSNTGFRAYYYYSETAYYNGYNYGKNGNTYRRKGYDLKRDQDYDDSVDAALEQLEEAEMEELLDEGGLIPKKGGPKRIVYDDKTDSWLDEKGEWIFDETLRKWVKTEEAWGKRKGKKKDRPPGELFKDENSMNDKDFNTKGI